MIYFGIIIFLGHLKKISYFHVFFLERSSFIFGLKKKIIFSEKRNIIFPDNTRRKMKKDDLKKISYFHVFFCERSSLIFCLKNKMTFLGKKISSFLLFFGKTNCKKKIWFFFRTMAKRKYGFSCSKIWNYYLKLLFITMTKGLKRSDFCDFQSNAMSVLPPHND